jgi:hypothetical protein
VDYTRGAQAASASASVETGGEVQPAGWRPAAGAPPTPVPGPAFDARGMPSVVDVSRRIAGANPLDTTARQAAAFTQLIAIVRTASAEDPAEQSVIQAYTNAARQADQRGQSLVARSGPGRPAAAAVASTWFGMRSRYDNEGYRMQMLNLCSPGVRAAYTARRR